KRFCSISFNIGRLLISLLMRTPPFLFSREKLFYQRRESSSYFLVIEGIFQLCPRKYFTHTKLSRSITFSLLGVEQNLFTTIDRTPAFYIKRCTRFIPTV